MDKKILITGGAGFIGSNLSEYLIKQGNVVICIDNFDVFYARSIKEENIAPLLNHANYVFIEGDLSNKILLDSIFTTYKIDAIIHLAANAGVRPSISNPLNYIHTNIIGTTTLLECMKQFGINKLIFASSSSVYGNNQKVPFSEIDNVDFPISPYATTKKAGELLTHTYYYLYNINVINLRFFTVYGPRQRPDLAIHKFFNKLYSNEVIDIYGDGKTGRDYTYIDDIISGISSSLNYLYSNTSVFETINLGNSHPILLVDLIDTIEKVTERKFIKKHLSMQPGDVELTYADISKAKKILNYNPQINFFSGITKFKEWYENNYKIIV